MENPLKMDDLGVTLFQETTRFFFPYWHAGPMCFRNGTILRSAVARELQTVEAQPRSSDLKPDAEHRVDLKDSHGGYPKNAKEGLLTMESIPSRND